MKTKMMITMLLFLNASLFGFSEANTDKMTSVPQVITLYSSPQLNAMASRLEQQYNATNSGYVVKMSALLQGERLDAGSLDYQVALVAENEVQDVAGDGSVRMVVGREIIIPLFASDNPFMEQILQKGVSVAQLKSVLALDVPTWGALLGNGSKEKLTVLMLGNAGSQQMMTDFFGTALHEKSITIFSSPKEFAEQMEQHKMALGFCDLNSLSSMEAQAVNTGFQLLPFDFNENGKLDQIENIYTDAASLNRGVWIGKYPKELIRSVFAITPAQQLNEAQKNFLKWMITNGQTTMAEFGIAALVNNELPAKMSKIDHVIPQGQAPAESHPLRSFLIGLAGLVVVILFFFEVFLQRNRKIKRTSLQSLVGNVRAFNMDSVSIPKGLFFDKGHTWVFMEKDGTVKVGLDDFIQKLTGPVSRVLLKDEGEKVMKGTALFTIIQEGKQLNICAPVSGIIKTFNTQLITDASMINASPFDDGWVYQIEPTNWIREVEFLRIAEKYSEWLKTEFIRLKDFIAQVGAQHQMEPGTMVLQDGGDVLEHVLYQMGPEVWEDFQTNFLDTSH
ncbi:MAG: glycine cleavage system protein H [Prolixibacteraceae bacterium]